jgi:hypothetical protein
MDQTLMQISRYFAGSDFTKMFKNTAETLEQTAILITE